MRKYERTHPWIKFHVDFKRALPDLWIKLGECQSKCEMIANVPLRPATAEDLYKMYLAKGVHATTSIEGNTLTEEQVRDIVDKKLNLPPSKEYLQIEVDNIIQQCNLLLDSMKEGRSQILTREKILAFNLGVLDGLELEENCIPGTIRKYSVGVGTYRGAPAEDCEYLLDKLCEWINSDTFQSKNDTIIIFGVIKAVVAHLYLAWIHPFGDGNGRTARLVELLILMNSNVPALSAQLLSNHYNNTRTEYYRQLNYASKSGGDIIPFVQYAVQGFLDGLNEQLVIIRDQVIDMAWRSYVQEKFRELKSESNHRQRHLVLDLSRLEHPVPTDKIEEISTRIAKSYAKKTSKTLARDLNKLREMDLIEKTHSGWVAKKETILSFLPERVDRKNLDS